MFFPPFRVLFIKLKTDVFEGFAIFGECSQASDYSANSAGRQWRLLHRSSADAPPGELGGPARLGTTFNEPLPAHRPSSGRPASPTPHHMIQAWTTTFCDIYVIFSATQLELANLPFFYRFFTPHLVSLFLLSCCEDMN